MTSKARKKQLAWQARNGHSHQSRLAAARELARIGEQERRVRGGGSSPPLPQSADRPPPDAGPRTPLLRR
ncbi:hypothetical protein [Spirillospora sp. NPDC048823]|uniref:hypothetical protein n=1 Tax=unclassified Spirillospora TaxID=2642701 RepID=UPI00372200C2